MRRFLLSNNCNTFFSGCARHASSVMGDTFPEVFARVTYNDEKVSTQRMQQIAQKVDHSNVISDAVKITPAELDVINRVDEIYCAVYKPQ